MQPLGNDRWQGSFEVTALGRYRYTVVAWADRYLTWRRELERRDDPADILLALKVGADLLTDAARRAAGEDRTRLEAAARRLAGSRDAEAGRTLALDAELDRVAMRFPDRRFESHFERELEVIVDPVLARFGAWYELFPRSTLPRARAPRHAAGLRGDAALCRKTGLRRSLPAAHPSDRSRAPQGTEQLAGRAAPGPGQPLGHRCAAKEGTARFTRRSARSRISRASWRLPREQRYRDRARHRIPVRTGSSRTSPSIRSGSGSVPTAPCSTRRIRRRSTRTSIRFDFETDDWAALHAELIRVVEFWIEQGRAAVPRRQSTYQALRALGADDRESQSASIPR